MTGPEAELVLRCIAPEPAAVEIRALADRPLRWDAVAALAMGQGVGTLVTRALRSAGVELPPPLVADERHGARWGTLLSAETVRITRVLERGGVPALALKGPALSVLAYGDTDVRRSGDVDVLVQPGDLRRAGELLDADGYVEEEAWDEHARSWYGRTIHQLPPRSRPGGMRVEVHSRANANFSAIELDHDGMRARAQPVDLGVGSVLAPSPEDSLVVVAAHALRSGWTRMEWVASVAWLANRPDLDWNLVDRLARDAGLMRAVALPLHLASNLLHMLMAPAALWIIANERGAERLAAQLADEPFWAMSDWDEEAPPDKRTRLLHLRGRERLRDKVRYLGTAVLVPTTVEARRLRLPGFLRWLYVPMRVARVVWRGTRTVLR